MGEPQKNHGRKNHNAEWEKERDGNCRTPILEGKRGPGMGECRKDEVTEEDPLKKKGEDWGKAV